MAMRPIFPFLYNWTCGDPLHKSLRDFSVKFVEIFVIENRRPALKKKFRTHVIKLDIAPMSFSPGQYLLVSASNNMLYYLSQ